MSKIKTSVRLALTDSLRDAFKLIKKTRYPFMKEDEILKMAFSKLYANDYVVSSKQTTVSYLLAKLRNTIPDFGKDWLQKRNFVEEELDANTFCEMILDSLV
jgi:hypothetical protein